VIPALAFAVLLAGADAREPGPDRDVAPGFVGINPVAPLPAVLPVPASTLTSVVSSLETGLAVSGGIVLGDVHALEGRVSVGPNSKGEWLAGAQVRYGLYVARAVHRTGTCTTS
jgi:hypothetical protein